jgi:hypothetical protein
MVGLAPALDLARLIDGFEGHGREYGISKMLQSPLVAIADIFAFKHVGQLVTRLGPAGMSA